jgi:hypothetical protein
MKIKLPHDNFNYLAVCLHSQESRHIGTDCQFWLDVFLENYKPCSMFKFWKCQKIKVLAFSNTHTDFIQTIYAERVEKQNETTN